MRYYLRAFFGDSPPVLHEYFDCKCNALRSFEIAEQSALSIILCVVNEDFFYDPDIGETATVIKKYGQLIMLEVGDRFCYKNH